MTKAQTTTCCYKKQTLKASFFSGWWFQIFFIFTPHLGKIPILTNILQIGLKPPTSFELLHECSENDLFHEVSPCFTGDSAAVTQLHPQTLEVTLTTFELIRVTFSHFQGPKKAPKRSCEFAELPGATIMGFQWHPSMGL